MRFLTASVLALGVVSHANAGEVTVAVAANFSAPMHRIAALYGRDTGHRATLVVGGTGQFYAQIRNGAPFDVLLAADDETPARLERDGFGVRGTRFTYAVGRLVFWSRQPGVIDARGDVLRSGRVERVAIANPRLAPYGAASIEVLTRLGVLAQLQPHLVQGENIAQAYQMVASGNAPAGFVALSQVSVDGHIAQGSAWIVPEHLHEPIRQDALLLSRARGNPAALELLRYLRGAAALDVMRGFGYGS